MAVASHDENISYYDVVRKELLFIFEGHFQTINSICFHPYFDFLLSGSQDCSIRVWDLNQTRSLKFVNSHQKYVTSVCFDLKGQHTYSCDEGKVLLKHRFEVDGAPPLRITEKKGTFTFSVQQEVKQVANSNEKSKKEALEHDFLNDRFDPTVILSIEQIDPSVQPKPREKNGDKENVNYHKGKNNTSSPKKVNQQHQYKANFQKN